jgi:ABC-type multidrug transport system fused ATPase/permease subunit
MTQRKLPENPFTSNPSNLWKKFWDNAVQLAANPTALVTGFLTFLGYFFVFPKLFNEGYYGFFFWEQPDLAEKATNLKSNPIDFISHHIEFLLIAIVLFLGLTVLMLLVQSFRSRYWAIIVILYLCFSLVLPLIFANTIGREFAEYDWKRPSKCFHFYMQETWPPPTYDPFSTIKKDLTNKKWGILFTDEESKKNEENKHIYQIKEELQELPRIEEIPIKDIQRRQETPCEMSISQRE